MADVTVAEMFPPGDFIEEELEARGWSKGDLAEIMGRPPQLVSALVSGKRAITLDTAEELGAAFGTSAELWLNLDTSYRLWKKRADEGSHQQSEVRRRSQIFSIAPVSDMARRQWIPNVGADLDVLESEVLKFLEINSPDEKPRAKFAARMATPDVNNAHTAWFKRCWQLAATVKVARFTTDKFDGCVKELRSLAQRAEDVRGVSAVLAEHGIRMLVVEHLPKTKIDGAAFWLSKHEPVVVLSMRHGRIDSFWFTLGHELGHVYAEDEQSLDNDLVDSSCSGDVTEQERLADEFASAMLVPPERLKNFIIRKGRYFSKPEIIGFARMQGVHPGIVVGQLQHRKAINYSHSREMLVNIREFVTESTLTDGWGKVPSL